MLEQFLYRQRTTLHDGDKGGEGNSLPRLTKVTRLVRACLASSPVILSCQMFMPMLKVAEEFQGRVACGVKVV